MPNIDDHILKAFEEGKFENLPGKGQPLRLEQDPFADPDWRLAHHMLKSSGYSLPWIELRNEILSAYETLCATLRRNWDYYQKHLNVGDISPGDLQSEWQSAQTVFGDSIRALNKKIADYNLQAPSSRFQFPLLKVEQEVEKVTSQAL